VVADNIYFGDSKRDGDSGGAGGYSAPSSYAAPSAPGGDQFADLSDDDGELPF
jgi:single-strand DNA-binding protein